MALQWEPTGDARGRIVLIHDLGSHAKTWWRIGPRLAADGWRTLALDLPGHGHMPRLRRPLDIPEVVQSVVDSLPGHADLLVGHGFGGIVALMVAGRYSGVAGSVIVEDPPSGSRQLREALVAELVAGSPLAHSDRARFTGTLAQANPGWASGDIQRAIEGLALADVPPIASGMRNRITWDLPGLVAMVRLPLLMLVAPDDPLVAMPYGESKLQGLDRKEARNLVPSRNFVELTGGHYLHRDTPNAWLAAVAAFSKTESDLRTAELA